MGWFDDAVSNTIGSVKDVASPILNNPIINPIGKLGSLPIERLTGLNYNQQLAAGALGGLGGAALGIGAAPSAGMGGALGGTAGVGTAGAGAAGAGAAGAGAGAAGLGAGYGGLSPGLLALGGANIATGLYGAKTSSDAAQAAADKSAAATQSATDLQKYMFDVGQANQKPWLTAGQTALQKQQQLLSDPSSYQQDPYNKFLQQQGQQGIERSAAAKGMLNSGNVLAELARFNQGIAGQGFADQYNRYAGLSGTGQTMANQMAGQAGQYASNVGNLNLQNAQNQANAGLAQAGMQNQMLGSTLGGLTGLYGMYNQNQQNNALMQYLQGRQ